MSNLRKSTFFVPNLHCPTCIAHIEDALYLLKPRPSSVSASIISHAVTVEHSPSLKVSAISQALDDIGFEVFDILEDPSQSSTTGSEKEDNKQRVAPSSAFEQALWKWRPHTTNNNDQKRAKHVQACQLCQLQTDHVHDSSNEKDTSSSDSGKKIPFVATESSTDSTLTYNATIAIDGMTCSSCVGSVTRALEQLPWVYSVSVSLLTHSASVKFHGKHRTEDLVEAVEDVGFGATLENIEEVEVQGKKPSAEVSDLWKATYAIDGMTCSACVGNITRALKEISWIKEVEVALISNSATVIFEGKSHAEDLKEAIEDVGYDATLDSIANLQTEGKAKTRRKVSFRISGMYCQHCPGRIEQAIQELGPISIEKAPTLDNPIMTVLYMPQQPNLTIRQILKAISDADEPFDATIYHPMTLEERSRKMQAREQRHIFYRVVLSVAAAIPSFIIGIVFMDLVPMSNSSSRYLSGRLHGVTRTEWATFITATPVYFFAADVFHRRTIKELRALWRPGSPTPILRRFYRFGSMNMLISFGTTIAYFSSIAELAILATHPLPENLESVVKNPTYFDSVVFLTMFLLIGRLLEAYTKAKTGDAVAELGKLRPAEALLVESGTDISPGTTRQIPVDEVEIGDIVRVVNGASPPFDGVLVEGESKFDESTLTGESKLIHKKVGDEVFSGTINKASPVSIRIDGVEGKSLLDSIMKVVREGQARRAPVERVADLLTGYFVPTVTLIALITWIVWLSLGLSGALPHGYLDIRDGGWPFWALEFAISVFVVACPCGIGLAAPTALFVGGGLAAKYGILVKGGGEAFQEASKLDCIIFDKTGTITQGREPEITDYETYESEKSGLEKKTIFGIVQAVESESSHPIAKAIVAFCKSHEADKVQVNGIEEIAGRGMKGKLAGSATAFDDALVGNENLMKDYNIDIDAQAAATVDSWKREGKSVALLSLRATSDSGKWNLVAAFAISDPLRPEAKTVVGALQKRRIDVWMISGDNQMTANAVGAQVGIPEANIIAGVLPSQKSDHVKKLQSSTMSKSRSGTNRAMVAMVGDGINDSPALTTADVGIAIGSGSDVAISSAEFVLVSSNLLAILTLTDLSRTVFRRIKFNFGWALIYNCMAIPIAAGVLYPIRCCGSDPDHITFGPVWAALAMALSSLSVVCSSLLLRTPLPFVGFRRSEEIKHS